MQKFLGGLGPLPGQAAFPVAQRGQGRRLGLPQAGPALEKDQGGPVAACFSKGGRMSEVLRGKKPRKVKGYGGSPAADNAAVTADGPGTGDTGIPLAEARTSR